MIRSTIALALVLAASPTRAGKVEMCVDETCTSKVRREKLDCKIHSNKGWTLGFKMSVAFAVSVGPEIGRRSEMNWNSLNQSLIRRYEELCDMHNKGLLSVAKFNERYDKLETYFEQAKGLKTELVEIRNAYDAVQAQAKKEFDDLAAEERRTSGVPDKQKVSKVLDRVDQLAQDVKELDPDAKKPAPAPDAKD